MATWSVSPQWPSWQPAVHLGPGATILGSAMLPTPSALGPRCGADRGVEGRAWRKSPFGVPVLSHQAHTLFTALLSSFPEGPLDLYPVTGIADVWGECPAPPDPQPPRCPPGEGRPACSSRSHSQFPGLQDRVVATTRTCDAPISRGGRGASHESSCGRDLSPWGLSPSDPRRRRSPGCRQLCAWGHAQLPEKRPHLLGPPECLSMKGLRPGPWPISEWAWAPRGPRGPPVWLPQDTDPRWTLKPPFQREKRPAQDPGDGGEEAQAPSWGEDGC
uniref:uncharacterized protein LOC129515914 n=1 Tax=Nyctereutes procyonoides TaxID=34880 RepID=UPI0024439D0F|nr:uncharacterized protein LOC129515914 [Nyctereutes procyonoides]